MSPKEFCALHKRYRDREERMDRRFATMQAFYMNVNADPKKIKRPFTADDFLGKSRQDEYVGDELLEKQLTAMFGVGPTKANSQA